MNKSSEINELASALSKFQGAVVDASKDRQGYNFAYADLSSVLEIARPLLVKNNLSVTQMPSTGGNGECIVETCLMHSSGQWMSSQVKMNVTLAKNLSEAQSFGSVLTYCRRYALAAVLGITQQDDDAATGTGGKRVNKVEVQGYLMGLLQALSDEDGTAAAQLLDEIRDTPEQDAVWKLLQNKQQMAIKTLVNGIKR